MQLFLKAQKQILQNKAFIKTLTMIVRRRAECLLLSLLLLLMLL